MKKSVVHSNFNVSKTSFKIEEVANYLSSERVDNSNVELDITSVCLEDVGLFFVYAYDAVTEEDSNEDAIWRRYL